MSGSRVVWLAADDAPDAFPPVDHALAEPDGLLAAGGDLGTERLLAAYRRGIFPWYDEGQPLLWWSPDPRCVFRRGDLHLARRLRRSLRSSAAELRFNSAFAEVVDACAGPRRFQQGTWITDDMKRAYLELHRAGWAHSIEVWEGGTLVGGLYGLVIGRALFGESMYSDAPNASKYALAYLDRLLDDGTLGIIDCQVQSQHLMSLGASIIPRSRFVTLLDELCEPPQPLETWPDRQIPVAALSDSPQRG